MVVKASPEVMGTTKLTRKNQSDWPTSTPPQRPRSRRQIEADLQAAAEAEANLPRLREVAASKTAREEELQGWESQRNWPQRKAEAMEKAKQSVEKVRASEEVLQRAVAQCAELPIFRAIQAVAAINTARLDLQDACATYVTVDFERTLQAQREEGAQGPGMARSFAAETASRGKVQSMVDSMDPGFSVFRSLPETGPQREILKALLRLAFPELFEKRPLDSDRR